MRWHTAWNMEITSWPSQQQIKTIAVASPPPPMPKPNFSQVVLAAAPSIEMVHHLEHGDNIFHHSSRHRVRRCSNSIIGAPANDLGCTASSQSVEALPTMHIHLRHVSRQRKAEFATTIGHRSDLQCQCGEGRWVTAYWAENSRLCNFGALC
ncbi:Hypothetical predicted protein [Olea europaea subsp. europaea]|uniref:Uncharacterized protein n=1 Tax=Olea europaea subsp. europaea TaxID=158383 RepID=A0A8S0RJL4_OLEEU|nr:Hypothetical predicted protein [Olea europaea subsp. europaea]